jgi:hypothetical protein
VKVTVFAFDLQAVFFDMMKVGMEEKVNIEPGFGHQAAVVSS